MHFRGIGVNGITDRCMAARTVVGHGNEGGVIS